MTDSLPERVRKLLARHPRLRDTLPGLAVSMMSLPASMATESGGWHEPRPGIVAWTVVSCVPLAWRTRAPWLVTAATLLMELLYAALGPHTSFTPAASLVALYTAASRTPRRTAWRAGLAIALVVTPLLALSYQQPLLSARTVATFDLVILATALGDAVRSNRARLEALRERAEHAERTREEEAARRVTEERLRIARDLHDVVAHHITLVNAQTGVAQHLVRTDPEAAYQALGQLKENSRAALDELRATVGLLRQEGEAPDPRDPLPGLDDLDGLIAAFRRAGLPVEADRTGTPRPATPSVDLAAYRILQEALTNTRKHAGPAATARIRLDYGPDTLRLTVTDDGRGAPAAGPAGTPSGGGHSGGHGLVSMRERATAAGGTLTAGPARPHGYRVEAVLPLPAPGETDETIGP
ncbi:sensor histidine kinase [Streptomyces sp. 7-21]|uniref:sensor histidine kinase n=1 Tax=Streptomyces sp. 7-21 TaxID=2802283 RepID=UPI001F1EBD91|nr:sensor histidine kinase [Streptomyces sp. 7-21]